MTGRHWDDSKRLLATFDAKLCGFRGEGSHHGGRSQISPKHPGCKHGFWKIFEFIIVTQARRTFYGFKKLLGRKVGDPRVTEEMARWAWGCQNFCGITKFYSRVPFELTQGEGGRVVYALNYGGKDVQLTSEQITASLFTKLKEIGENALKTEVSFYHVAI